MSERQPTTPYTREDPVMIDTSTLTVGEPDPWIEPSYRICGRDFDGESGHTFVCTAPHGHSGPDVACDGETIVAIGPPMTTVYFTFGVQYAHDLHPTLGSVAHPDGWAEVTAPSYGLAVLLFSRLTEQRYAFDYRKRPSEEMFPRGCILRITMQAPVPTAGEPS